jgi:predicted GIY-YIG superfamily endonuclease
MTNNIERRLLEHKQHSVKGFTSDYNCEDLIYFEETNSVDAAIAREKQLKNWSRYKKIKLIRSQNPLFRDLSASVEMTE